MFYTIVKILIFILFLKNVYALEIKPKLPLYIYSGKSVNKALYYVPSYKTGDYPLFNIDYNCKEHPKTNKYCMKFIYKISRNLIFNWVTAHWTYPPFNRGNIDGGIDLSEAKELSFWVRSQKGRVVFAVSIGGNYGVFSDTAMIKTGLIHCSTKWKKIVVSLKGHDLTHISVGLSLSVRKSDYPKYRTKDVVFYIDDVKFK